MGCCSCCGLSHASMRPCPCWAIVNLVNLQTTDYHSGSRAHEQHNVWLLQNHIEMHRQKHKTTHTHTHTHLRIHVVKCMHDTCTHIYQHVHIRTHIQTCCTPWTCSHVKTHMHTNTHTNTKTHCSGTMLRYGARTERYHDINCVNIFSLVLLKHWTKFSTSVSGTHF